MKLSLGLIYLLSATVGITSALLVRQRRRIPAGTHLVLMLSAASLWALCDALELLVGTVDGKRLVSQIQYLGVVSAAPFFFHTSYRLSHKSPAIAKPTLCAIWGIPLSTLLIAWTSQWHPWLWRSITLQGNSSGVAIYEYGWWFWVLTAQHYVLMLTGTLQLVRTARQSTKPFKKPLWWLIVAVMLPWLGNVAYVFKLGWLPGLNWLSISITISGVLLSWTVAKGGLLDLLPRVRETLIDRMTDPVVVLDSACNIIFMNGAAAKLLNLSCNPSRLPQWIEKALKSEDAARAHETEVCLDGVDGLLRYLDVRITPIQDRWNEVAGRLLVMRDVSDRKLAETAAVEWQTRYEAAIRASGQILYDWQPSTNDVTYAGDVLRILGYSTTELAGGFTTFINLVHPDDRPLFQAEIDRVLSTGSVFKLEYRIRRKDNVYIHCEDVGHFLPMSGGRMRMVGFIKDITRRKKVEEERQKLEVRLRQALKMQALGTLAGGIAHDFNNILGAIIGNVELASGDVGPEHPAQESLQEIRTAGHRAHDLVKQVLAFSCQQELVRESLALDHVAQEAVRILRAELPSWMKIDLEIHGPCPMIEGDASQIQQAIINLGTNAWQASVEGRGRILISTDELNIHSTQNSDHSALKPGRYGCLSIRDEGVGMSASLQRRIFDPFFTTRPPGKGSGLGLAVVHGIIENHGGVIRVQSEPGRGSVFHLYFPAVEPYELIPQGREPHQSELAVKSAELCEGG